MSSGLVYGGENDNRRWRTFIQRKSQTALAAQPVATARKASTLCAKTAPQIAVQMAISTCLQYQSVERPRACSSSRSPASAPSRSNRSNIHTVMACDVLMRFHLEVAEDLPRASPTSASFP